MAGGFSGNRGIVQGYLEELISEGLTNSQIVDFLKINDLGYRTSYMYQDINRFRIEFIAAEEVKGLSIYEPIPDKYMRTWFGETGYKYRVVVEYDYFDTSTLNTESKATTLYYNEAPSQEQVLADFEIRQGTLESGFGSTANIQEIFGSKKINYFRNERQ